MSGRHQKGRPDKDEAADRGEASPSSGGEPEAPAATEHDEAPPREASGLEPVASAATAPDELDALRKERDELRDQLLRKRADFENYRKRVERDREQAARDATAALLRELIPTLDNLERALAAAGDEASLRTGVELTLRELSVLVDRHGLRAFDPTGQLFDPEAHQALLHEAAPGYPEGTVVEVFRKGYSMEERLLRPALVKVAKGAEPGPDSESGGVH